MKYLAITLLFFVVSCEQPFNSSEDFANRAKKELEGTWIFSYGDSIKFKCDTFQIFIADKRKENEQFKEWIVGLQKNGIIKYRYYGNIKEIKGNYGDWNLQHNVFYFTGQSLYWDGEINWDYQFSFTVDVDSAFGGKTDEFLHDDDPRRRFKAKKVIN